MTSDIFVAQSKADDALVGPLSMITYVTSDGAAVEKMLVQGMGMQASDPYVPIGAEKAKLDAYYGFSQTETWQVRQFFRGGEGANVRIRLIILESPRPQIRPEVSGRYLGGLSIGFPMKEIESREKTMQKLGFESVVGNKRLEFSNPAGETYVSEEIHFPGPENIYVLGVNRPDIFVPVGPIDTATNIGAPAYSAQCVFDSEATISFYREILGYEIRRDMTLKVGDKSGLKLKEGSDERFIQAFAPGANTGYLVFLDHMEETIHQEPAVSLGPTSRGLTMWSFASKKMDEVYKRAVKSDVIILQEPTIIESPFLPKTETLILSDPGGFPIEIFAV